MLEKCCCEPHVKETAIQSEYPSQNARNKHNHLKHAAESPMPQGNDDGSKWDTSRESPCSKKIVKGTVFDCLAWSNLKEEIPSKAPGIPLLILFLTELRLGLAVAVQI